MKKIYKSIFVATVVALACSSCDSDDPGAVNAPAITIVSRDTDFPAAASTGSVRFEADGDVTVSTSSNWITATVDGDMIVINCSQNNSLQSRTGVISVKSDAGVTEINIIQEGVIFQIPESSDLSFSSTGETRDVAVSSNIPIEITSEDDWITGSFVDGVIKVTVTENQSFESRNGDLIVTYGANTTNISVCQHGAVLEVFGMTEWNCLDTRKTMTINLPFECDIQFETDNPDWIVSTVNPNTKKWTITASANNTGHVRIGSFTYTVGDQTGTIVVRQCNFSKDLAGNDYRLYFTKYDKDLQKNVLMFYDAEFKKLGSSYRVNIPKLNLSIPVAFNADTHVITLCGGEFCGIMDDLRIYTVFDFYDDGTYITWSNEWNMIATPSYSDSTGETCLKFVDSGNNPYVITSVELHAFTSGQLSGDTSQGTVVGLNDMELVKGSF